VTVGVVDVVETGEAVDVDEHLGNATGASSSG
jgi:hypothetical protein